MILKGIRDVVTSKTNSGEIVFVYKTSCIVQDVKEFYIHKKSAG